jgi:2-dehydro-3-deoxygluconokinase
VKARDVQPKDAVSGLSAKPASACGLDQLSLGEVMLRLDPGELRIRTTRSFDVWAGGGEYNVARGLRRTFGLRTGIVTALVDNEVGRLIEDFILQGGVDTSYVRWCPFDGVGRGSRNGLNFTERGFGIRGAVGVSDRGHTAASQLVAGDIDWEAIFGGVGVRWLHTGGIFAGLSETTPTVIEEAIGAARRHGTVVSYDLNYRPSLWDAYGGRGQAQSVNRRLAALVDVLLGNEEDFAVCLGIDVPGSGPNLTQLSVEGYEAMLAEVARQFPNVRVAATTLRTVRSASVNGWGALAWAAGRIHRAVDRPNLEILDRVGGGDSFAAGLIYGLLEKGDLAVALEYGAAHGALAMTTPGDTSMATLAEVVQLVKGAGARIRR